LQFKLLDEEAGAPQTKAMSRLGALESWKSIIERQPGSRLCGYKRRPPAIVIARRRMFFRDGIAPCR
jgi:hypothetical protein